jgi:hypothetical protein
MWGAAIRGPSEVQRARSNSNAQQRAATEAVPVETNQGTSVGHAVDWMVPYLSVRAAWLSALSVFHSELLFVWRVCTRARHA